MPLSGSNNSIHPLPTGLEHLWFDRPQVVLERGRKGAWDEFGVRDPALLVDGRGHLVKEQGAMVLYFTGSHNRGRWQASGRAISFDDGLTWQRSPDQPVLAPRNNAWDSGMATTPWVLRGDDDLYRLYYQGGPQNYYVGMGLAISRNGIDFERVGSRPILKASDFSDLPHSGPALMGAFNVVRTLDGRYLLTFEGTSVNFRGTQIFAAISDDGEHFHPLNNGNPFFSADHVRSWSVRRVANPRITVCEESKLYMLAFNGASDFGMYGIGLAFTRDFKEWWEHPNNPLIYPSGRPLDDPFSGRIEGGVLVKEDLQKKEDPIRMFLMSIPRRGPSHKNGVVGLSYGWRKKPEGKFSFTAVSSQPTDIALLPAQKNETETLTLTQGAASTFPPRVHFNLQAQNNPNGVKLDFLLDPDDNGSAFIVLGDEIDTTIRGDGIRLWFNQGQCYLWTGGWLSKNLRERLHFVLIRRMLERIGIPERWPRLFWKSLGACKRGVWQTLSMERTDRQWAIRVNKQIHASFQEIGSAPLVVRDLAIQSYRQSIQIRNLQVSHKILPHT